MKTKQLLMTAVVILALAMTATAAHSQAFKGIFGTKLVLTGDTTDPINTLTLIAGANASPLVWHLPATNGSSGYVLQTDGSGNLTWQSPGSISITFAGDVTGGISSTVVERIRGALLGTTTATAGNLLIADGSQWNTTPLSGDATISSGGVLTLGNSSTIRGHLGLGSIATQSASNVSITGGSITGTSISGSTGSFTDLSASGTVTLPAGSVGPTALALTDGHILVGNSSGHAADVAMGGDASILNTGAVSVNAVHVAAGPSIATAINNSGSNAINGENVKHDATLAVDGSHQLGINLANNNTWTGRQTMGAVAFTPASNFPLSAGVNNDIDVSSSHTVIRLTAGSGAARVTSVNNPVAGRMLVIVNADATNVVTIVDEAATGTAANRFHTSVGNIILMPAASASFIYDGTMQRWCSMANN